MAFAATQSRPVGSKRPDGGALSWDKFVANVLPRVPMRRWGTPSDFGGLAVHLASSASSYHTGDVITGGYHSF